MGVEPSASASSESHDSPAPEVARHVRSRASALRHAGVTSWFALGVIALVVVVALALSAVSGILIPLVIAVIIGLVLEPLAETLMSKGVPATLATMLTLLVAVVVASVTIAVVVLGFLDQWPEIYRQVIDGWNAFVGWTADLDVDARFLQQGREIFEDAVAALGQGAFGAVASTFYGAVSLVMGTFFALFFLFFVLRDGAKFSTWVARWGHFDAVEVDTVAQMTRESVRGYFRSTAITALLTAPIFMIPLVLLGVPLAIPILVLYFFMSFIPYLGAWLTGAFVVLIAFGSTGPSAALILGITFIISNGTLQSAVSSWALGSSLKLHPVAVLLATMIGGTVAGLLGMVLGPPVLAVVVKSTAAIRGLRTSAQEADPEPA